MLLIDIVQNKFRGIYVARTKSLEYEKTCHVRLMHGKFKGIPDHEVCKAKQVQVLAYMCQLDLHAREL